VNITFRIKDDDALEAKFINEAQEAGLRELKGHRILGGCRASLFNAMSMEGVEALISFMENFKKENPK